MRKILGLFLVLTLISSRAFAALSPSTIYQIQSTATASNVNAGGFNIANANFLTNGAITSGTGNAPVISSASYTFVAGDVGAWIWLPAQTNIIAGFYKIASVSAGAATLSASVGTASIYALSRFTPSTTAGCATTATPTSVTFGVDYSQLDTAPFADTDLASTTGTTNPATVTSAAHPFGVQMVGNLLHVNSGTSWTAGWYEIVSVSGTTATLDKAVGSAATLSSGTGKVGGALSLGSSDSTIFSSTLAATSSTASTIYFIKGPATYTISGTVSTAPNGTTTWPIVIEGYSTIRGDRPALSSVPVLNTGSAIFTESQSWAIRNLGFTSTATTTISLSTGSRLLDSKVYNTSATAARIAVATGFGSYVRGNDIVSLRGTALAGLGSGPFTRLDAA